MTSIIDLEDFATNFTSKLWRLENLYYIIDKNGNKVKFKLNWAQKILYENFWHQMLILKARQLGCTTFFAISYLDDCLWYQNMSAGIIADKKESSEEIFKKKVKFAYDSLDPWIKDLIKAKNDRVGELVFQNGSSFRVSTGFRSGTYTRLLISEFGKICCKSPDVAKEIVAGSLNTVSKDEIIVIESTAAGREGYFYDMCKEAEQNQKARKKLSSMQQRFFFFPWYLEPSYKDETPGVIVSQETNEYLDKVQSQVGIKIMDFQRQWYEQKFRFLGDSMRQEYPSTPEEAFETSNEGLYYGKDISKLREKGHICKVHHQEYSLVHTSWDIGADDHTVIWCFQISPSGEIQFIDYYENRDEAPKHYADWLISRKYTFGTHILPHDAGNRSAQTNLTYADIISPLLSGHFIVLTVQECNIFLGIQQVRFVLSRCVFDETRCQKGIKHLESYRKMWDDKMGCYKSQPFHDEHSHASDSMRYAAVGLDKIQGSPSSLKDTYKALRSYWGSY